MQLSNLTGQKVLVSDSSKNIIESTVTSTELGYLDGITSNIQTQLNSKVTAATISSSSVSIDIIEGCGYSWVDGLHIVEKVLNIVTCQFRIARESSDSEATTSYQIGRVPKEYRPKRNYSYVFSSMLGSPFGIYVDPTGIISIRTYAKVFTTNDQINCTFQWFTS